MKFNSIELFAGAGGLALGLEKAGLNAVLLNEIDKQDENNVIRMLDFEVFRKHLLITFELLSMNLYEFIKANNF